MTVLTTAATATAATASSLEERVIRDLSRLNPMAGAELERDLAAYDLAAECPAYANGSQFVIKKRNGEIVEFSSNLSDQQLRQALSYCAYLNGKTNVFAASLLSDWGKLSDKQCAWAHKLANDWLASRQKGAEDRDNEIAATFAAIVAALQAVKGRSKSIKLSEDCSLHLSRCKTKVWVKNPASIVPGDYGMGPEFLGTVTSQWGISKKIPSPQREQIETFVESIR